MKKNLFAILTCFLFIQACNQLPEALELTPDQNEKTGKWGYVDENGQKRIPYLYEEANPFSEGLARIKEKHRYGFIDKSGKMIIPATFSEAENFSDGLAVIKEDRGYGYIDKTGGIAVSLIYTKAGNFSDGLAIVESQRMGRMVIDKAGEIKIRNERSFNMSKSSGVYYYCDSIEGNYYATTDSYLLTEKLLKNKINEVNDYYDQWRRLEKDKNSKQSSISFSINRPYLVLNAEINFFSSDKAQKIYSGLWINSEIDFNEQSIDEVKTLIVKFNQSVDGASYQDEQGWGRIMYYRANNAFLVYFDMDTKECIGHDMINAPELPNRLRNGAGTLYQLTSSGIEPLDKNIIKIIESRIPL